MDRQPAATVFVEARDWRLETAVARTLSRALGATADVLIGRPEDGERDAVVVATDNVLTPNDVATLASHGTPVVLLAALPNDLAETRYRRAGVRHYLPMAATGLPLVSAVTSVLAMLEAVS